MEHTNILLIEDSYCQALQVQLLIQQQYADYCVFVAHNGIDGQKQAKHIVPQLILLDINLPGPDGFEILSQLKRNWLTAHIPVVIITSRVMESDKARAKCLGVDGYIIKNNQLAQKLAYVLRTFVAHTPDEQPEQECHSMNVSVAVL